MAIIILISTSSISEVEIELKKFLKYKNWNRYLVKKKIVKK